MLSVLKEAILRIDNSRLVHDMILEGSSNNVRDMFLDDVESVTVGAENDPEIKMLIDKLPEYDESDNVIESEIAKLTESINQTL